MDNLQILLWNANGLRSRKLELETFLQCEKIDVALITETHCTQQYFIPSNRNYDVIYAFHPSGRAQGGAAIYIKKSLQYSLDLSYTSLQFQLCAIRLAINGRNLSLASLYCPPSCKTDSVDFDILFQRLSGQWLVGGDYNAKYSIWGSRLIISRGREPAKVLQQRNYEAISNGEPTYWPSDRRKIPDVIDFFVSNQIHRQQCHITTLADLNSDHTPVKLTLAISPLLHEYPLSLVNRFTDWDLYRDHIEAATCHHVPIRTSTDLDTAVQKFTHTLQTAACFSTPSSSAHGTSSVIVAPTALLRRRRQARKRWQRVRSESASREYRRCNELVHRELRKSRNIEFQSFMSTLSPHPDTDYSLWRATKKF